MFAPNSTIRLMKGVPLDSTYRNTIWFDNEEEQFEHFNDRYDYKLFPDQTYQRYGRGALRISALADELYDYNYLSFRNDVYGAPGKTFYCFINSVEYIAERTTEIKYEIDYMQTYFFNYDLGDCFVEREHSITDEIGENIVPEDLEFGDYFCSEPVYINTYTDPEGNVRYGLDKLAICVASTAKLDGSDVVDSNGEIYNGIFSGLSLTFFSMDEAGVNAYNNFINKITEKNKIDGVVSVSLLPLAIANKGTNTINIPYSFTYDKDYSSIAHTDNSIQIRNNKLFTYPYNFLYVTNMQGNSASFHFEYFEDPLDSGCIFSWYGDFSPNCSVILSPWSYKGITSENFDEKMILTGYPEIAFNVDTYKAWLAQNKSTLAVNALSTVTSTVQGVASTAINATIGNPIGAIGSAMSTGANLFNDVASTLGTIYQKSIMPNQARGSGAPVTLASFNKLNFMFMTKYIRPEFVDIIDGFFDMYGYATHLVKKPNRNVRPYWTYTKTRGAILLNTSCPSIAIKSICRIYDNGITFWKQDSIVGDYSQDNRPR